MLSSLLSGLRSGLPAAPLAGKKEEREAKAEAEAAEAEQPPQRQRQRQRQRRASGSFTGDASSPPSFSSSSAGGGQDARRPLVIEWPQVKAFLAMADASLRRKTEQVEVREREGGHGRRKHAAAAAGRRRTMEQEKEKKGRLFSLLRAATRPLPSSLAGAKWPSRCVARGRRSARALERTGREVARIELSTAAWVLGIGDKVFWQPFSFPSPFEGERLSEGFPLFLVAKGTAETHRNPESWQKRPEEAPTREREEKESAGRRFNWRRQTAPLFFFLLSSFFFFFFSPHPSLSRRPSKKTPTPNSNRPSAATSGSTKRSYARPSARGAPSSRTPRS